MKIKLALLLVFTLVCVFAQTSGGVTQTATTQEQLQQLQEKVQRLNAENQKAKVKVQRLSITAGQTAESLRDARETLRQTTVELQNAQAKLLELQDSIVREAQKRSDDQLRTRRTVRLIASGAVLALGILSVLVWRFKRGNIVILSPAKSRGEARNLSPKEIEEILKVKRAHRFKFTFEDGREFWCTAKMGKSSPTSKAEEPRVHIEGDLDDVTVGADMIGRRINKLLKNPNFSAPVA